MSKSKIAKEIKEATKILSYLGRAEKYFDLELVKNGRPIKPLLLIPDIIDPLRQITEVASKVEDNEPMPHYASEAFNYADKISTVCDDILTLNPRGLVSADKTILAKLRANIQSIKDKANFADYVDVTNKAAPTPVAAPAAQNFQTTPETLRIIEQYQFPANNQAASPNQDNSLSYNFDVNNPASSLYTGTEPQYFENEHYSLPQQQEYNIAPAHTQNLTQIYPAKQNQEINSGNYLATSYPGMNLQEVADIIEELANDPKNHNVVLLEHSSKIKPISLGIDIIEDLRQLAPIADAFENSTEILNKAPISILSKAEQIITICADISALSIDGLDLRKKKLLSKFIKQDITKLAAIARNAYPEAFSPTTDSYGEMVTNTLVDFAELLTAKSAYHEDRMYAELLSLVMYQIAEYANYNELRTKFDVLVKKNRLNSNPKVFDTKIKMAWLRAVTYVPQIARHSQEIAGMQQTNDFERRLIEKSLEILQLAYIDARDKYATYLQDLTFSKAA